nr:DUF3822 family protein [Aggregatimonas sangjinii]
MTTIKSAKNAENDFYRLSIQISLNGLSFCMLDTVSHTVISSEHVLFHKELTPYQVLEELKQLVEKNNIQKTAFSEVVVIHRNNLFTLVPKPLFHADELANYLKFNAKILANDHIAHDEIEGYELMNVYVPFVNINNYLYGLFGEFVYKHHGTVMVQSLLSEQGSGESPICYAHLSEQQLDITVVAGQKLQLFNNFDYSTQEDFLYYLLFTLEQLKLNPETIKLRLFGEVEENDTIYKLCYDYIKNIAIFTPTHNAELLAAVDQESIDFTVLNAL